MTLAKIILAVFFSTLLFTSRSQSNSFPITNSVTPTVTAAMGDTGGKSFGHAPDPAKTRHYYITAEPRLWDFAPEGRDVVCGLPLPSLVKSNHASMKVRYVAYADATFTRRLAENPSLGILGPVLRGLVGECITVTFWNRTDVPLSMHPHGLKYDKDSEGSYYQPNPGLGAAVGPGAKFTYVWQVDDSAGPLPAEPSSKAWLYHSHVNGDEEANLGLIGCIIVTDPKRARADGTPADVDRELASLFMIFNESGLDSEAAEEAARARAPDGSAPAQSWAQVQEIKQAGERYAINGRIYGNLAGLEMNTGERVRWYLFALGSETDQHTPHWHGMRIVESGHNSDVVELLPASMKVADMVADNPGQWLFHCHVAEHMQEGMFARVTVYSTQDRFARRAPEPAFLGLPQQSVTVQRAEAAVDFTPGATQPCEIKIEGEATVPDELAVDKNPVKVELGGHSILFNPDRDGVDSKAEGSFHVANASRNSSEYGMVYGGRLKFTLSLSGKAWRNELVAAGFDSRSRQTQALTLPFSLQTAGEKSHGTCRISVAAASH